MRATWPTSKRAPRDRPTRSASASRSALEQTCRFGCIRRRAPPCGIASRRRSSKRSSPGSTRDGTRSPRSRRDDHLVAGSTPASTTRGPASSSRPRSSPSCGASNSSSGGLRRRPIPCLPGKAGRNSARSRQSRASSSSGTHERTGRSRRRSAWCCGPPIQQTPRDALAALRGPDGWPGPALLWAVRDAAGGWRLVARP